MAWTSVARLASANKRRQKASGRSRTKLGGESSNTPAPAPMPKPGGGGPSPYLHPMAYKNPGRPNPALINLGEAVNSRITHGENAITAMPKLPGGRGGQPHAPQAPTPVYSTPVPRAPGSLMKRGR